jgi:hypothetical protein
MRKEFLFLNIKMKILDMNCARLVQRHYLFVLILKKRKNEILLEFFCEPLNTLDLLSWPFRC